MKLRVEKNKTIIVIYISIQAVLALAASWGGRAADERSLTGMVR